ncbi:hypothetical protein IAG15_24615, partial [Enterococcus faecalis]|nr:hypothetical protein [Enterococcus faecalis]
IWFNKCTKNDSFRCWFFKNPQKNKKILEQMPSFHGICFLFSEIPLVKIVSIRYTLTYSFKKEVML